MARRKKRLTHKKKSETKVDKKTPDGLSERTFLALAHEYGSFTIKGPDHEQYTFNKGDMACVQYKEPEDGAAPSEEDCWIGKIDEIRGEGADDVWVRVQWFWSPSEVAEVIKSFDPTLCGKYEKLYSDNADIISVFAFVRHVDVKMFDEVSICQVPIGEDEWFSRYQFHYTQRRVSPKVTHEACTICKIPYTPGAQKILHFCPRPGCRKFYHQSCLVKRGYTQGTRTYRLLETWPEVDRTVSVEKLCDRLPEPPKKRQRTSSLPPSHSESKAEPFASFPAELIAAADQPIIRGAPGGGVVGNMTPVAAARQLIFKTLIQGGVIPDDWETMIDLSEAFPEIDTLPNCFCPSCYSPI